MRGFCLQTAHPKHTDKLFDTKVFGAFDIFNAFGTVFDCRCNLIVDGLYEKCYEDNAAGKITDEWFCHLSAKYSAEKEMLRKRCREIQETLRTLTISEESQAYFIEAVRKFMRVEKLTQTLLYELIDRIEVYNAEGKGKGRTQKVVIYYRFVGDFWKKSMEEYELTNDSQKGTTVLYSVDASSVTA